MKYLIVFVVAIFTTLQIHAQTATANTPLSVLPAFPLELSWHKTQLLIFPEPIKHADRGDSYVLAETFKAADNILKVKAGKKNFEESNLQVVTNGGKVYCFTVTYRDGISAQPIDMGKVRPYAPITFRGLSLNSKEIEDYAKKIVGNMPFLSGGKFSRYGMEFSTEGIYIKNDVLFFQFHLHNDTHIGFESSSVRFFIRDRKKAKRTAVQDKEVEPLFVLQSGIPESGKGQTIIAAFPRFTIAEGKLFTIEIMEKDGDRNPTNHIKQKKLLKARNLY
ncbi:conjugative transposon protein TraN [Chitinophaga sp. OAE865]|uniref:conjugative transposon protein TraN n=1 Tax=Chitinophaga sp. OAE865 TaxID=2817898 RepID=UPI001AE2BA0D